jgi:predicted Zn-ribbon and HTH transcriptional regulator
MLCMHKPECFSCGFNWQNSSTKVQIKS